MLTDLHLVLFDVVFTVDDLVEELLELVVVKEAATEHLGLNHINPTEEDLESNELLN